MRRWIGSLVLLCAGCGASVDTEGDSARLSAAPSNSDSLSFDERHPVVAAPDTVYQTEDGEVVAEGDLTLLVVFDTSGSMMAPWGSRAKYQVADEALISAVAQFENTLTVGAIQFPTDADCDVAPLSQTPQLNYQSGSEFLQAWGQTEQLPVGNTPLHLALAQADAAISAAQRRGLFENRFRVVIFSDGEPTCEDQFEEMLVYPTKWQQWGIHTYVVGLPGSQPAFDLLGALANAGGTGAAQGGGAAIANDTSASQVYESGVAENDTENIVVDDDEDLDDVTHALAR